MLHWRPSVLSVMPVVASSGNTDLDEHLEWNLAGSTDKTY
jgi:hypothetical protein